MSVEAMEMWRLFWNIEPESKPKPIAITEDSIAADLLAALSDLEAEISSRFTDNYEKAPEFMTEPLRSKVLAARDALAKGRGEAE